MSETARQTAARGRLSRRTDRSRPTHGRPVTTRDAFNLYLEAEHTKANLVHAFVVDVAAAPSRHPGIRTHADAVDFARSVLHLDPIFTHRLYRYPADLALPFWIPSQDVDPSDHVRVTVQTPGDVSIVRRRTEELSNRMFDLTGAPLWHIDFLVDLHGVDGVPDGGTVMIVKFHHSAIDGVGASDLISRMLSVTPADPRPAMPLRRIPTVAGAAAQLPRDLARLATAAVRYRRAPRTPVPTAGPVPATRFNGEQSPDMVWDLTWFDLDRIKALSRQQSVTVNDVMTTIMSLALSTYLDERGELPDDDLSISMPMSTRSLVDSHTANRLAIIRLGLHTTVADPVERLHAVHRSAGAAKAAVSELVGSDAPDNPLQVLPSPLIGPLGALTRKPPEKPETAPLTTMSSNVSYGTGPLALRGAPVVGCYGVLPTVRGVHLAHSVRSIGSSISLSVASTARALPDIEHYLHLTRAAARSLGY